MKKTDIQSEAKMQEEELILMASLVNREGRHNSMLDWIKSLLKDGNELAKYFLIPSDKKIRDSLLTMISENNSLAHPIINTVSNRIALLLSGTDDLKNHPLTGAGLQSTLKAFDGLVKNVGKYRIGQEVQKTVTTVYQALKDNRLHTYKTLIQESDLRIVLKTLQVDRDRSNHTAIDHFLIYLFKQLQANHEKHGYIQHARHAWWAVLELFELGDVVWLQQRQDEIERIIMSLCETTDYTGNYHSPGDLAQDLSADFYERIWVTIDMMRIFRNERARAVFKGNFFNRLEQVLETNMRTILLQQNDGSIRSIQCKLIFLYEATIHFNYADILKIINSKYLNISSNFIGKYLYSEDLVFQYREIEESIIGFVKGAQPWKKHSTTCLMVSGSAGQGKSELANQIAHRINEIATENSKNCKIFTFAVGKEIISQAGIDHAFKTVEAYTDQNAVRVVFFDEVDKADGFDFFTPFLSRLEAPLADTDILTFWIFAQSTHASFEALSLYAVGLENKSCRDFLTRIQLGHLDIPDLRSVFIQRIFTIIGYARGQDSKLNGIATDCLKRLFFESGLNNNRDLIGLFTKKFKIDDHCIMLKEQKGRILPEHKIDLIVNSDGK